MSDRPLISVITVTYNAGGVIRPTLESVKSQTFKDFEYLVIDGASKDDTIERIEEAGIPQTRLISEPDKGLYNAMNKGLRIAKGEYVIFLNAGDAFRHSDTLEEYAAKAKEGADIIYGDTVIVDKDGKEIGPRHLSCPEKLTKNSFSKGMLICHQAFMVRKQLAPGYNEDYRFSADYDWCIRCMEKGDASKFENLNKVTINYLSDGLTDKNKLKSLRERFRIMAMHYGFFPTLIRHFGFIFRAIQRGKL